MQPGRVQHRLPCELRQIGIPTLLTDAYAPVEITSAKAVTLMPNAPLKIYQNAPHGLVATDLSQVEAGIVEFPPP